MTAAAWEGRPYGVGSPGDEIRIAIRCRYCRRWISDPISVAAGAGKSCREANGGA